MKLIFKLRKTSWLINVLRDQFIWFLGIMVGGGDGGGAFARLHSVGGKRIKWLSALAL